MTISPLDFHGSDSERIQAAIGAAKGTGASVVIPQRSPHSNTPWMLDRAILLPSDITIVIENTVIQLSDDCRDNIFRSENVGPGISEVAWRRNIRIIGVGNAILRGADNPRSTGEGKTLALAPTFDSPEGRGKMSYGTDAGRSGVEQTGDWRNHGILIAYVDGFTLRNLTIENTHCWAVTHERVWNAEISHLRIFNPPHVLVGEQRHYAANRDGINLRQGCKRFRIHDISGETGDDFIALTLLGASDPNTDAGYASSYMVTTRAYTPGDDDIEDVRISNIVAKTKNHGIALRTIEDGQIRKVSIDGLTVHGNAAFSSHQSAILFGGRGYGTPGERGGINGIYAMNVTSSCPSAMIHVEAAIEDCVFMNGIYTGEGKYIVSYHDFNDATPKYTVSKNNEGRGKVGNVQEINLVRC